MVVVMLWYTRGLINFINLYGLGGLKILKIHEKWSKTNFENIFWYGRSAKMAKTTIEKPVLNFGLKSTFFGKLGN